MAKVFAKVLWVQGKKHARATRQNIAQNLRSFSDFLNWKSDAGFEVEDTLSFTYSLFQEFGNWLVGVRNLKENSAANRYSSVSSFIKAARALEPKAFSEDFSLPEHIFVGVGEVRVASQALSLPDFEQIVTVAEKKVADIRQNYREGDVPESMTTLIPFMILLAVKTAMNPYSVYEFRRDSLEPHIIESNALYVTWAKRRSRTRKQKQLHRDRRGGVIELIRFLLTFTSPLVEGAAKPDQKRLFLYRGTVNFILKHKRIMSVSAGDKIKYNLGIYIKENNLPKFSFVNLRATAATHFYHHNGGSLRKTQSVLGHKSRHTTEQYIGKEIVRPMHNRAMREAQAKIVQRVTVIPKKAKEALTDLSNLVPLRNRKRITDGEFDTGYCKCADPYNSPQEGQKKGECCTLLDACWRCPNALFFLEDLPRVIALRNYFYKKRTGMKKSHWETHYGYKIEIIDRDIIGAFTDKQIADAERKAASNTEVEVLMRGEFIK